MPYSRLTAGLLTLTLVAAGASAQPVQPHAGHDLGSVDFPVSCSAAARTEFNRAVALLHHMTYPQAREAFQQVATTDPHCAMAHWGIAMTLFQPLWPTRPSLEARQEGWDAVQKAKALQPPTERERLFVAAAEAFFLEPSSSDYWLRIRRWEQAMAKVYAAFPDDPEAAAFYALAHLATTPVRRHFARACGPRRRDPARASTAAIRIIPARCTISSTPTTCRAASASRWRSRASTKWSRRAIRTRCTCRRTSTRGWATGTR